MARSIEDQLQALARRHLDAPKRTNLQGEPELEPYAATAHGSPNPQRLLAAAAVVAALMIIGGALLLARNAPPADVASGNQTHAIPPGDATGVSGVTVPNGATINFEISGRAFQLTQISMGAEDPSLEELRAMMSSGALEVDVAGLGPAFVACVSPSTGAGGSGVSGVVWFSAALFVQVTSSEPDPGLCDPSVVAQSEIVDVARAVRLVPDTQWRDYVQNHSIDEAPPVREGAEDCLVGGAGRVCASREDAITLEASGLEPGSQLTVEVSFAGQPDPQRLDLTVGDDGREPGAVGVSSLMPVPVVIHIDATASDGTRVTGDLNL